MARTGPVEVVLVYGTEELTNYVLLDPTDPRLSLSYEGGEVVISPKNPEQAPKFEILGPGEYAGQLFEYPVIGVPLGSLSKSKMLDGDFELVFCSPDTLGEKINGDAELRQKDYTLQNQHAMLMRKVTQAM